MNASTRLALLGLALVLASAGSASALDVRPIVHTYTNPACNTIAYQCDWCSGYWSPQTGTTPIHVCERNPETAPWEDYFCVARVGPWCLWFTEPPLHLPPIP